jgi:bifunctional non-homologous end joining protein LigD
MLAGDDLRRQPMEDRKKRLATLLQRAPAAVRYVEHLEGEGPEIYRHVCALGLEGIVSKRRDLGYKSGRSHTWVKVRNPAYSRK